MAYIKVVWAKEIKWNEVKAKTRGFYFNLLYFILFYVCHPLRNLKHSSALHTALNKHMLKQKA